MFYYKKCYIGIEFWVKLYLVLAATKFNLKLCLLALCLWYLSNKRAASDEIVVNFIILRR